MQSATLGYMKAIVLHSLQMFAWRKWGRFLQRAQDMRRVMTKSKVVGVEVPWRRSIGSQKLGHNGELRVERSFKNPPPGQSTDKPYDDRNLKLGSKVGDLYDSVARKNFRLVVIVPDSVEQTDLSDPTKSRRFRYTFDESTQANAGWRTEELWP
ncbi:hypothetical protein N0V83_006459 [Neocucurbitaria cava]|uniref:Pyridoxal 5'-phosphate synthase n=1 Tax=Neocucurbitaria cava TaxID=798079 RepID=A0A9W8Y4X2_9PLEO|nr:hypothetical protein N0V83_006459 [Neocucurbitaria cava]